MKHLQTSRLSSAKRVAPLGTTVRYVTIQVEVPYKNMRHQKWREFRQSRDASEDKARSARQGQQIGQLGMVIQWWWKVAADCWCA